MDKRTILAFIFIGLIVLLYPSYMRWVSPPPPEEPEAERTFSKSAAPDSLSAPTSAPDATHALESSASAAALPGLAAFVQMPDDAPETVITVETDAFRARVSSRGARLVSLELKPSVRYLKTNLQLIPPDGAPRPGFRFWTMEGPVETAGLSFRAVNYESGDAPVLELSPGRKQRIEFELPLLDGRRFLIWYDFEGGGYSFSVGTKIEGGGLWVRDYGEIYWQDGLANTEGESGSSAGMAYSKAFVFYAGDVLEDLASKWDKPQETAMTSGETRWAAVRSKYFLAALIPDRPALGGLMINRADSSRHPDDYANLLGVALRLPLDAGDQGVSVRLYLGPLDTELLDQVDPTLQKTMSWGWFIFSPFSKAILWSLKKMGQVIPNYGICIIIFSILVKLIVWPLTRSSYRSMSAMSSLQPQIKELREKYRKDPQRMQKETMRLYKEAGVSPMGGCLPTLLQMPLLIAMFIVFQSTIEFRRAPFFWWIKDLSKPDYIFDLPFHVPFYGASVALMPLVMGVTTYFQSKSTMTDPNQKMLLYFMPIMLTVMFNQFPSGLTFYYTLFNVWTILQQKYIPTPVKVNAAGNGNGSFPGAPRKRG